MEPCRGRGDARMGTRGRRPAPRGAGPERRAWCAETEGARGEMPRLLPGRPGARPRLPAFQKVAGRAVEFPQDGPSPPAGVLGSTPSSPGRRPRGWGSGREGKPGTLARRLGVPHCACPEPHALRARTGPLFIFNFLSPGRAGPARWTLSPGPGALAGDAGPGGGWRRAGGRPFPVVFSPPHPGPTSPQG